MAADEAAINYYRQEQIPVLRIYGWSQPFVTLGYNQSSDAVFQDSDFPFTRRITGGAAILHDQDVTYSLVCGVNDLSLAGSVKDSYKKISSFLFDFYGELGLTAGFACDSHDTGLGECKHICFLSHEHYDILICGKKIGGNAQKRMKNIIFQHGSIPWNIDFKLADKTLNDCALMKEKVVALNFLVKDVFPFDVLQNKLAESFQRTFAVGFKIQPFTLEEKQSIEETVKNKYSTHAWKYKA